MLAVQVVPELVVPTIAAVAVDVPVALGAHALPAPVLEATVSVPAPAESVAPVASVGRATPVLAVAPMAAAVFAVTLAPAAPVRPALGPATPVQLPIDPEVPAMSDAPPMPAVGPSLSDAMVQVEKRVFYLLFTCLLVLIS